MVPQVAKRRGQTSQARWRGVVKVQRPLAFTSTVGAKPPYLVTSADGSITELLAPSKALRRLLRGRLKVYVRATVLGDGTLQLNQEVPGHVW